MLGFEDYRLDLRYWEIEKKEVSENGEWQTLHFRKRERRKIEVVKDYLTESPKTYTAYPGHNKQVLVFTRKAS